MGVSRLPARVIGDHALGGFADDLVRGLPWHTVSHACGVAWPMNGAPGRPGETEAERDDRNLLELLQELRVAGLGVQVIFGFLLALPFTTKFRELGHTQRALYVIDLTLAAASMAVLLGPVAYHRLVFRQRLKRHLLYAANVMAIAGLATVGLTVCAAVLMVLSVVAKGLPAVVITIFTVCLFAGLWFVLPLSRRRLARSDPPDPVPGPARSGDPR